MDNIFTIHYSAYLRYCQHRSKELQKFDSQLLGILIDMHPVDEKGFYSYGRVDVPVEELWKRRMLKVPSNLEGTIVRIIYDYDHDVNAATA